MWLIISNLFYSSKISTLAWVFALFVFALIASCRDEGRYSYSIKDFNNSLQPYLTKIVSQGIVGHDSSTEFIEKSATDADILKLSKSEHPVLRAIAYRLILSKPAFNHFDVIMNNLDDSAIVAVDDGEFGIGFYRVADDMLWHGKWKDTAAKNVTVEAVILEHNYLNSAYIKIREIPPKESYYSVIKEMAQREINYDDKIVVTGFKEIENALYALAKFKKQEDIRIIQEALLRNCWRISETSFRLMKEYPDAAYLEVYETYYTRRFYYNICHDENINNAISFINSIASYKNEKSESILGEILNRKPLIPCMADANYLKEELIFAIWNNPCEAYKKLRKQVESSVKEYEKNIISVPMEPFAVSPDTSAEPVRWW
ncbi:MAG TPA: hypothetical protein PL045_03145 [Chitinophagaceae bacterium]|nr:hypothetical protein [Chitinophagaceae bacterium]